MAAQVADRFDLGPDARLEVEAARGEQGQVRRLVTARGVFALKETFGELDVDESELTAAFQARCHDAGVPCPRPLADGDGCYVAHVDGQPVRLQTWADVHDADPMLDPAFVGTAVARLHGVVVPAWKAAVSSASSTSSSPNVSLSANTPRAVTRRRT